MKQWFQGLGYKTPKGREVPESRETNEMNPTSRVCQLPTCGSFKAWIKEEAFRQGQGLSELKKQSGE